MKKYPNYLIVNFIFLIILSGCSVSVKYSSNIEKTGTQGISNKTNFAVGDVFRGYASYYGDKFHNKTTASGEPYNMNDLTAAHRTLPFGTIVKVTNLSNNKSVTVRINDRGPFVESRIIDLSKESARQIGLLEQGVTEVEILILYLP